MTMRDGHTIVFEGKVNDDAVRAFLPEYYRALDGGSKDLSLNFRECTHAYPDAIMQLVVSLEAVRSDGVDATLTLPSDDGLSRLFLNTNWAHFLAPKQFDLQSRHHEWHLPVSRFTDYSEQQRTVDQIVDIVMGQMRLSRNLIDGLEWSLNEITDNVLNHADSGSRGGLALVTTYPSSSRISFVVGDSGRGIPASMREGFPGLQNDAQALEEAVKAGVTRSPDAGQGNGLAGTLRIATGTGGSFTLTSGRAQLKVYRDSQDMDYTERLYPRPESRRLPGTVVSVDVSLESAFSLRDALGFTGVDSAPDWDIVDARYMDSETNALRLVLSDQGTGFGTRSAGALIRTKCLNLLDAEPGAPLVLDWGGLPLVSSSFADEAIGKLFVALGPLAFSARVRHVQMEPLVRSLIDRAILQRVAQQDR